MYKTSLATECSEIFGEGRNYTLLNVLDTQRRIDAVFAISRMEGGSWLNPRRAPSHSSNHLPVLHARSRWFGIAQFALTQIRQFAIFTAPNATRSTARSSKSNLHFPARVLSRSLTFLNTCPDSGENRSVPVISAEELNADDDTCSAEILSGRVAAACILKSGACQGWAAVMAGSGHPGAVKALWPRAPPYLAHWFKRRCGANRSCDLSLTRGEARFAGLCGASAKLFRETKSCADASHVLFVDPQEKPKYQVRIRRMGLRITARRPRVRPQAVTAHWGG